VRRSPAAEGLLQIFQSTEFRRPCQLRTSPSRPTFDGITMAGFRSTVVMDSGLARKSTRPGMTGRHHSPTDATKNGGAEGPAVCRVL